MKLETSQFPMKSIKDLNLSMPELKKIQKETPYSSSEAHSTISNDLNGINKSNVPNEVMERSMFSKYLIDPNRFRFSIVVRIMTYALKFFKASLKAARASLQKKSSIDQSKNPESKSTQFAFEDFKNVVQLSDAEISDGEMYFFKKCASEIKHFLSPKKYEKITYENNGVLMYTGRILMLQ